jgi:hypothetical protein
MINKCENAGSAENYLKFFPHVGIPVPVRIGTFGMAFFLAGLEKIGGAFASVIK